MKQPLRVVLCLALFIGAVAAMAQQDPEVGDVRMSNKQTLLQNLTASPIHHKLLDAIKLAGLTDTFSGSTRVTLFAPTDDAFTKLPAGTLTSLEQPDNRQQLRQFVLYHVINGKVSAKRLMKLVKKGKGSAVLTTQAGVPLTAKRTGNILTLTDSKGTQAVLITLDVNAKNGTMHVMDAVLLPN